MSDIKTGETYFQYIHHGSPVWTRRDLVGTHREHCLCYGCGKFKPGQEDNCNIAARLFVLCQDHHLVTPVYECPEFALGNSPTSETT
jgi:hypothetical protein